MKLQYLGHSAFLLQTKNANILIDPFISNNPHCPILLKDLPRIDYILVTHGHSDHFGDTLTISRNHNSIVICNYELSLYLSNNDIPCHSMHIGGKATFDFGSVKMLPALHGSCIIDNDQIIYAGNPCGFLICIEDIKVHHAGDTGLSIEMSLLKCENIDISLLPIGGNFTMDICDCLKAIQMITPKIVIPMHYNTFEIINQNPIILKDKNIICETKILQVGECLQIN